MNNITLILPCYNQPQMLLKQLDYLKEYPPDFPVIIIDDHSTPALDIEETIRRYIPANLSLYRIDDDIPWNRNGARNLGAFLAQTEWIIQTDIDHVLAATYLQRLLVEPLDTGKWYRFPRDRFGKADETRRKDALPPDAEYGPIKPHIDSYLMTRRQYLSSPYDERYRGFLGGGSPFLARQTRLYGEPALLPKEIALMVYTRDKVKDSSVHDLSRDTSQYKALRREIDATGDDTPIRPLNFKWHKVI